MPVFHLCIFNANVFTYAIASKDYPSRIYEYELRCDEYSEIKSDIGVTD